MMTIRISKIAITHRVILKVVINISLKGKCRTQDTDLKIIYEIKIMTKRPIGKNPNSNLLKLNEDNHWSRKSGSITNINNMMRIKLTD